MQLRDSLSPLLAKFLSRDEWNQKMTETKADCMNCNQARGVNAIYKESLKCCTFYPFLPNFLIGALLESNMPGRKKIEDALLGLSEMPESNFVPLGLMPSVLYQKRFHAKQPDGYGNDESLLCPHFLKSTGGCGIWQMRPSPCRSFFCESSYGIAGIEFWAKFEKFVSLLEVSLAQEALLEQGFDENEVALSLKFLPKYSQPDPHGYQGERLKKEIEKSWLEFGGDKIAFYKKSYAFVLSLNPEAKEDILKGDARVLEQELFSDLWPRVKAYART